LCVFLEWHSDFRYRWSFIEPPPPNEAIGGFVRTYLFDDVAAAKTIGNNEKVYLGIKRIQKTMRIIEMLKKYTGAFLFR
jgi:hypothetical protein